MNYRDWKIWLVSLPWSLKWFVVLLLVRPIVDLLWDVKTPFLNVSPLDIVGVATPALILLLLLSKQLPLPRRSPTDVYIYIWGALLILNAGVIYFTEPSLLRLKVALKMLLPIYLYLFCRRFVRSERDLEGTLQTILYSAILPFALLTYEALTGPWRIQFSRGVERIMGGYSDVVYVGSHALFLTLIVGYFTLANRTKPAKKQSTPPIILVALFSLFLLSRLNHASSYGTFIFILLLFVGYSFSFRTLATLMIFGLIFLSSYSLISTEIGKRIVPLFSTDLIVIQGDRSAEAAFNGRGGIWKRGFDSFENEQSHIEQSIGMIGGKKPYLATAGVHNDYLRILFTTGYIGLGLYLLALIRIVVRSRHFSKPQQFLTICSVGTVLLMSIATTPTFYTYFNYLFMPILSYVAIYDPTAFTNRSILSRSRHPDLAVQRPFSI